MNKIRLLIADDHILIREGLVKLLQRDDMIEIIDEVGDGQGAINIARKTKPDIILMDINMPGTDGIEATRVIKREMPEVRIIALTIYEDDEVIQMVKAGVSAYLLKDVAGSELTDTIHRVMKGEVVIHPRVARRLIKEVANEKPPQLEVQLSRRELDVLNLLVQGKSNRDMAEIMFISEKTIKNHLTNIFRKMNVRDRTQAVLFALKNKLVEPQ
jgi:DNA-binding NarL/FixJ family response regulator